MPDNGARRGRNSLIFVGIVVISLVVLLPWWRNHAYLRDFYDYGLVISGVGRVAAGERPYVDFVTPIQTGTFLFNGWVERWGGGTFQAMTLGGAALSVLGVIVLGLILSRRWAVGLAMAVAGAIVSMTAAQHLIIWHNSLGALCIAVAALGAAFAPVLRRDNWGWHLLVAVALVVGGVNKINAHLVAVCVVFAWALLSGFNGAATWRRVAATVAFAVGFGGVVPLVAELAWTHASPEQWWHNVVALPLGGRVDDLGKALHWKFYFSPLHSYYGSLPLPQLGAIGVLASGLFVFAGLRAGGWKRHGLWLPTAALCVAVSGVGLLATNYEIAYVAMGAWLSLLASLWLGFGLRCKGPLFFGGLVLPILLIGAFAWQSAWLGQRSQFGHSQMPRSRYLSGETIGPDFVYFRGTFVPPEIVTSIATAAEWRNHLPSAYRDSVFYGGGLEWLERVWPAQKKSGIPLWMHLGTNYGPREEAALQRALSPEGIYRAALVSEVWDYWGPLAKEELAAHYTKRKVGPVWFLYERLAPGVVDGRPLEFLRSFGGNVDSTQLNSDMSVHALLNGQTFLGVSNRRGEVTLMAPSYRTRGEMVLERLKRGATGSMPIHFSAHSVDGAELLLRWSKDVLLPNGESELVVPFEVETGGLPLKYFVEIPAALEGKIVAGVRALSIQHSVNGPEVPPTLVPGSPAAEAATAAMRAALLPPSWSPEKVFVRRGQVGPAGFELKAGGEIWIRLSGIYPEVTALASMPPPAAPTATPVIRVLFYKGARMEMLTQAPLSPTDGRLNFKAWSAEADGWLVILVDAAPSSPPVTVKILSARQI